MAGDGVDDAKLQSFLQWAAELGVSDTLLPQPQRGSCLGESLLVSHFPGAGGRGLALARELRRGEVVLKVPRNALITRESLLKDEKLKLLVEKYQNLSSVQVDDAIWAAEKAVSKAQSDWNEAVLLMTDIGLKPQLKRYTSWLWASATISSRTLHVPWDDAGCLCPVGDLFNYVAPQESFLYSEDMNDPEECSPAYAGPSRDNEDVFEKPFDPNSSTENLFRLTDGGYEKHRSSTQGTNPHLLWDIYKFGAP